jgi:hypothetical protein
MSNPVPNQVPNCTHVKTNGVVCGSPAVSGTPFCYHHSAVKTALGRPQPNGRVPDEGFAPIPFVFAEDRASMQINFFLLLQAFNEQRIDISTYKAMLSILKSMAKNLGKLGSLTEVAEPVAEKKAESRAERRAREREEDPNYIPPGYADEVQRRVDREWEEKKLARQQQDAGGTLNGSGNSQ